MEELYEHIFSMEGVSQHPAYHGFSYGLLIVEDGKPICCFYVDDNADRKLQDVLSHGMFEIYSIGEHRTEMYYGYVTDGSQFFCEEMVYPRDEQNGGSLL